MKKEMSLRIPLNERIKCSVNDFMAILANVLSQCVEEEISPAQTLRILHAIIAFAFLVFSFGNVLISVLFLIWFALTLIGCRRMGVSNQMKA